MITIFDNIAKRRKKSLKHHSGAMLRTVLNYARVSKVALLLTVELVVKIAADIFCLIHTNRQADSNTGIKRHNFSNRKIYAVSEYNVAKNEKVHSDVTAVFRCIVSIESINLNNSISAD